MWPTKVRVEGEDDLPQFAGHAIFKGLLAFLAKGTLLAHGQPVVQQNIQDLLCSAPFQQVSP